MVRSLRHHTFLRTNPFEVSSRLDGLEERFRIVGREALADALAARRAALERVVEAEEEYMREHGLPRRGHETRKWIPDALHLLLELADLPAQRSRLSELEALQASSKDDEVEERSYRWDEIAREDGWSRDRELWMVPRFASDSDDEDSGRRGSDREPSGDETAGSSVDDSPRRRPEQLVVAGAATQGTAELKAVEASQKWRHDVTPADETGRARKLPLTEAQVVREVLAMLGGLPTTLFVRGRNSSNVSLAAAYQLEGVSWDVYRATLGAFVEAGRCAGVLREFVSACGTRGQGRPVPLIQVFADCVSRQALVPLQTELTKLERELVAPPRNDVVVSLLRVEAELRPALSRIRALADVVDAVQAERSGPPRAFRYLELLFDATTAAQLGGDGDMFRFLGGVFFTCFREYVRPIRLWMDEGVLIPGDRVFFVAAVESGMDVQPPLSDIWRSRFKLRRSTDGRLHAPAFLQPAANHIFAAGKSIVVLRHLGRQVPAATEPEPELTFESVCRPSAPSGYNPEDALLLLAPFPALFDDAFAHWTGAKRRAVSATLRAALLTGEYALPEAVDALHRVFLGSDGAAADELARAVFDRIDRRSGNDHRCDARVLTDRAREIFATAVGGGNVDVDKISVTIDEETETAQSQKGRQKRPHTSSSSSLSVRTLLPDIHVTFRLPWPVQMVVPPESMPRYQAIFTLLLQLRRARHVLTGRGRQSLRQLLADNGGPDDGDSDDDRSGAIHHHHQRYLVLRARCLWLVATLHAYLADIVLAPLSAKLRAAYAPPAPAVSKAPPTRPAEGALASVKSDSSSALPHEERGHGEETDVDSMAAAHASFISDATDAALLGTRLRPIRDAILDLLDLCVGVAVAHDRERLRRQREDGEARERSLLVSPPRVGLRFGLGVVAGGPFLSRKSRVQEDTDSDDDGDDQEDEIDSPSGYTPATATNVGDYGTYLADAAREFDRLVRFVAAGLRGAARASTDSAAGRWDTLAEMLEAGYGGGTSGSVV